MAKPNIKNSASFISDYENSVAESDILDTNSLTTCALGLFGEIGSVMSAAKKLHREGIAYNGFRKAALEEFGDALWYFAAICRRNQVSLEEIINLTMQGGTIKTSLVAGVSPGFPIAEVKFMSGLDELDAVLTDLGSSTAIILTEAKKGIITKAVLSDFAFNYLCAIQKSSLSFAECLEMNQAKVRSRFISADMGSLPTFDLEFPEEEQLPMHFEIEIRERQNGKSYLKMNNMFMGDPLSDNIKDSDGYRFHDVFHFAFAAILHWSPTFRGLTKRKRKSDPLVEAAQDSGRAVVIDEGISAYIFSYAKDMNFFEGQDKISFDLLKDIQNFVRGYEVEECPLNLWEKAILQGYEVFREVKKNNGGVIICSRSERKITYSKIHK